MSVPVLAADGWGFGSELAWPGILKISRGTMSDPLFIIAGSVRIRQSVWKMPFSKEIPADVVAEFERGLGVVMGGGRDGSKRRVRFGIAFHPGTDG